MQAPARRPARRNARPRILFRRALLALVPLAGWHCTDAEAASLSPLLRDLARGAGEYRPIGPRLSITRGYAPCRETPPPPDGTVTGAACPAVPTKAASSRTLRRVRRTAREAGVEPAALQATALMDLLWSASGSALDGSIQSLHTAARLTDRRAPVLADLSAAYLLRAERMQTPGDLDRALEAAEEAVELDSASTAALYNRALALERIGLPAAADDAWTAYLRADSESGWANEARAYLRPAPAADVTPPANPSHEAAAAFARRAPQQANTWGWETLLPGWAAALQAGNAAEADCVLRLAEAVGAALVSAGRDATLADAVAAIRAADSTTALRLAGAHGSYGEARQLYDSRHHKAAHPLFLRAAAEGEESRSLQTWARLFAGASLAYLRSRSALAEIRAVALSTDSVRYPALAGRARWMMGTTISRDSSDYEEARRWYLRGAPLLERAGEGEYATAVRYLGAYMLQRMGSEFAADLEQHATLIQVRAYPWSPWRHGLLYSAAEKARDGGLYRAALHYYAEDLRAPEPAHAPESAIETRLARARLMAKMGLYDDAMRDVRSVRAAVPGLPADFVHDWFTNDLRFAEAEVEMLVRPAAVLPALDSVVDFFRPLTARLLPVLLTRAQAYQASGNTAAARQDLRTAVDLMIKQGSDMDSISLRRSLFGQARPVLDQLVLSLVAGGRHREALQEVERARAAFGPPGGGKPDGVRILEGEAGVVFAAIGDTLLAWTVRGDTVRLSIQPVDRAALLQRVERGRSTLELRGAEDETRQALGELYDVLIRPVEAQLGGTGRPLRIVADESLAGVPFAALYDHRRGRYLVQDHLVRIVPSLSAAEERDERRRLPARPLLVADPAFDRGAYPGFERLPGAAAEVSAIADLYPAARRLSDITADSTGVSAALKSADLVHFAGHAVLDDARPERSYLLLAGQGGAGRLTLEKIGGMDLREVRLVVLSACETAREPDRGLGGLAGVSAAFMGAGADGVLGSLWRVDDALTRELMIEFHRAYRSTGDAAGALRAAQLSLLHSPDPRLRSPAAWAGFVHLGS